MEEKNIIIYDGICNFCNGAVSFIIKRDPYRKFVFTPIHSNFAQNLIKKYNLQDIGTDTVFLIKDGRCSYKTEAALEIAKELSGYWHLFNIFKIIPIRLRDSIYDLIAKNRYKLFGKNLTCIIPPIEIKNRFFGL